MEEALLTTSIASGNLVSRGKVRDIYATDDALVLVATDRISAFDSVLSPGIAGRGEILTRLSTFWFRRFADRVPNHLLATDLADFPAPFNDHPELAGRSVFVRKLEPIPVECVARGYLSGSGWKEYKNTGAVCEIRLPEGLKNSDKLEQPIFTPSTKADSGHDENISIEEAAKNAKVVEALAELNYKIMLVGEPSPLPQNMLDMLVELAKKKDLLV